MDYNSWVKCEAVPLSNGIMARRTGLRYMKSPEEISAYYLEHFGDYWFNELPKTDNTYCPTSQYYGCTLAPGIPLIPNLCRRPLRSPGSGDYEYSFISSYQSALADSNSQSLYADENHTNHLRSLTNNFINSDHGNGKSHNHLPMTQLPRRRLMGRMDLQDSGVDSDSEYDDGSPHREYVSQNTVTWLSWIITTVTTVITTITETILGRGDHQNHINTRVPLKHSVEVAWYQYPFLWLYQLAMLVHRMDIWVLHKVNSVLQVDSWGTPEKRRRWALILLLIPLFLWAGYKFLEWLWDEDPLKEGVSLAWLLYPFVYAWEFLGSTWGLAGSAWEVTAAWLTDTWASLWLLVTDWFNKSTAEGDVLVTATDSATEDDSTEPLIDIDWSRAAAWISWPYYNLLALFASGGEYLTYGASTVGEGSMTVLYSVCAFFASAFSSVSAFAGGMFHSVSAFLVTVFTWIMDCIYAVPAVCSSALAFLAYPFKSISTPSSSESYIATAPPTYYSPDSVPAAPPAPPAPASLSADQLLHDKQLLAQLVHNLLSSKEFEQSVGQVVSSQATTNQEHANQAINAAVREAMAQIDKEVNKFKEELSGKITVEESLVESKMGAFKQQIQKIQEALSAHNAKVLEQAALGNSLAARMATTEQAQMQRDIELEKLKNQLEQEMANMKDKLSLSQENVVVKSEDSLMLSNPSELEGLINSTVERLLAIYDADKIAKVDYALSTSGGSVLSVRCTETYTKKNAQYYMWGYPLWSKSSNDPNIALEPAINPGECWAFTGSRGYMVIELSENITVTGFTMEHLPRSLSRNGNIDTAPKDFRVVGLESEQDGSPIMLGSFRYEDNGISLQHFKALEVDHAFKIVELVIESNHGNLEYTCLYRFRVHGQPVRP